MDPDDLRIYGHTLDCTEGITTYIGNVWGIESDICHDGDHHVLLEVELARVETPRVAKGGKLLGGEDRLQEFSSGEG